MRKRSNEVEIERDVKVTAADGAVLLADVYHPVGVDDAPTILERTPYGRRGVSAAMAPELAARGYRYVLQACRGTDGSGGSHSYFAEASDGRDAADWIADQAWFNGALGSFGASYMGFTQWALASTRPPHLKAMAIALSASVRAFSWYPGGSLALEVIIPWDVGATQFNRASYANDVSPDAIERRMAALQEGFDHLPLGDVLRHVTGEDLALYQDQLAHAGLDDPFWAPLDYSGLLPDWTVPTLLVDGWHDYPLPRVVEDYAALAGSPAPTRLRIGAGGHLGGGGAGGMTDAPLAWFDTWLRGEAGLLEDDPVTVEIQGQGGGWRNLASWPPPAEPTRWYLGAGGALATSGPAAGAGPDRYRYDPADPTPSRGGIGMLTGGAVDNRELEARPDVLVYTSQPLAEALVVAGPVEAELCVESSLDHTDFFVRLCDVHPDGRSVNVCDGLRRFGPGDIDRRPDGTFRAPVAMWPAGHRFAPGHRVRVLVASGSHPVYARNLGTGEAPATATRTVPADQAVHHAPGRLSFVTLPHLLA